MLILAGLLFFMAGDVLLIFQSSHPRAFLGGLVAFLLAHVVYIAAFIYVQSSLELGVNVAGEIVAALALALLGAPSPAMLKPVTVIAKVVIMNLCS